LNLLPAYKVDKIKSLIVAGTGMRTICGEVGVAKGTVARYRREVISKSARPLLCSCGKAIGHRGWCQHRLSKSVSRQEFLLTSPFFGARIIIPKPRKEKIEVYSDLCWPYSKIHNHELPDYILRIDRIVPAGIPEKIRADICQDIVVDYLAGSLSLSELPRMVKGYIRRAYNNMSEYRNVSLYSPVKGTDDLLVMDVITNKLCEVEI